MINYLWNGNLFKNMLETECNITKVPFFGYYISFFSDNFPMCIFMNIDILIKYYYIICSLYAIKIEFVTLKHDLQRR